MHLFLSHAVIKKILVLSTCVLGVSGLLSACDSQKSQLERQMTSDQAEQMTAASAETEAFDEVALVPETESKEAGRKLTEIAGQASLPAEKNLHEKDDVLSKDALKYAGRYSTKIPCTDAFARCQKGQADYILSLLADGTAHRTIVYLGRMYSDKTQSNGGQFYRQDRWSYDAKNHEVVLHFVEGYDFYYKVIDSHHLVIDLEKNQQQEKVHLDVDGKNYLQPEKAYSLKKTTD